MFSLIITVISIALVAGLTVATVYYGGSTLTEGAAKSTAAAVISQGQQIQGTMSMFSASNGGASPAEESDGRMTSSNELVSDGYMSEIPTLPGDLGGTAGWAVGSGVGAKYLVTGPFTAEEACLEVEKKRDANTTTIPQAATPLTAAQLAVPATGRLAIATSGLFGCIATSDAGAAVRYQAYYKFK